MALDKFGDDLLSVMGTFRGRRFMYELLVKIGFWHTDPDPLAIGSRAVATDLVNRIMSSRLGKECFLQMMQDNIIVNEDNEEEENEDV